MFHQNVKISSMVRKECSIRFYLKPTKKKNMGGYPIFCRIIYDRKKSEFFVGQHIEPIKWDEKLGRAKKNSRLNAYLNKLRTKILSIKHEYDDNNEALSAQILKQAIKGNNDNSKTVLEYFEEQVNKFSNLKEEYAPSTIKKYKVAQNLLTSFIQRTKKDYPIKKVDYKFLSDWDQYLISYPEDANKVRIRNTANSYHKRLKKILGEAVKEKKLEQNPYINFPIKDKKVEKEALSIEELRLLFNHDLLDNPSLKKARDIFLFTCFSGVRFQDGQDLSPSNIYKDENNILWLKYTQGKVNRSVDFPLLYPALSIIEKYNFESEITGKVLPRISNQKTNLFLKSIAELLNFDKKLTHHIAKHTFASTILRENEIPMEVTKEWLGHSTGNDITLLYAKLGKKIKIQYAEHLNKIFKEFIIHEKEKL